MQNIIRAEREGVVKTVNAAAGDGGGRRRRPGGVRLEMADAGAATRDDWLALVARTLKDKVMPASLTHRTADGLTIAPLYTADDAPQAQRV